jgi:hypothetical protein
MPNKQTQRRLLLLGLALIFALIRQQLGSAHEPITTKVTFTKEVARIFQRSCWGCHSAGKFKAEIPLTTYEEARPWAKAIKEEVLEKRMPPYQAVKGYGSFQHDYILPQRDVELLVSWIEGGAPKGDVKNYPKAQNGWTLGQPDLLLQPEREAKLASGEGEDEVMCFSLPTGLKQARWLRAIDFQPGNGAVVYRAEFALENKATAVCKFIDADEDSLGTWQPGQAPLQFPTGTARALPAGARIRLTIHYRNNGEAASDRSQLALYFAKEALPKSVRSVVLTSTATLPVKDELQQVKATHTLAAPAEAVAVRPLLYPFGKSIEVAAHRPDGTVEVLIWAKDYRYAWQPSYVFKKPVALPRGTRIEVTAYNDNTYNKTKNSNDPAKGVTVNGPLCELLLTQTNGFKAARR